MLGCCVCAPRAVASLGVIVLVVPRPLLLLRDAMIAADGSDSHQILHEVDTCLGEDFDLRHSTIQVEHG